MKKLIALLILGCMNLSATSLRQAQFAYPGNKAKPLPLQPIKSKDRQGRTD